MHRRHVPRIQYEKIKEWGKEILVREESTEKKPVKEEKLRGLGFMEL